MLNRARLSDYKVTLMNGGIHKVNVPTEDDYRKLREELKEWSFEHYTYEDKNTRPIKVMARGIDPTCSEQLIKEHLHERKFAIQEVANILKRERKGEVITKRRLPLHMLVFDKEQDIRQIYEIKKILGLKVKIEPLRKRSTLIPQCKKCQGYGHTQKYCQKEPRCVKCAGPHSTVQCDKHKSAPAKCYNCGEAHPASYRGCIVAKKLQKQRDDILRKQKKHIHSPNAPNPNSQSENPRQEQSANIKRNTLLKQASLETTYAQIIKSKQPDQNKEEQTKPDITSQTLQQILAKLEEQNKTNKMILERITKLESSNKTAAANKKK